MQKKKLDPKKKKTLEEDVKDRKKKGEDPAEKWIQEMKKNHEFLVMKKIEVISTGSFVLNRIIGDGSGNNQPGGFPRGGVTEIFGDESTGKTTLALLGVKNAMQAGGTAVWADFEHSLRLQGPYIENLGIDMNSSKFVGIAPMNFEDGAKRIGESLIMVKPAIIVIDSVTAMMPKVAVDTEAGSDIQIGKHAKLTSNFLNWMTKRLDKYNTALVLISQTRVDIQTTQAAKKFNQGPKKISSGGNAPKFFTTVRIDLRQTGLKEKVNATNTITGLKEIKMVNQMVKATCIKNKFDVPYKSGPIYFTFGKGVDNIMSLVLLGENTKIFKVADAGWISWEDPQGKYSFKVQGRMNVVKYLEEHPEVLQNLTPYLVPSTNTEAMVTRKKELEAMDKKDMSEEDKKELESLQTKLDGKNVEEIIEKEHIADSEEDKELHELDVLVSEGDSGSETAEPVAEE
jgi:recombination protein RecA